MELRYLPFALLALVFAVLLALGGIAAARAGQRLSRLLLLGLCGSAAWGLVAALAAACHLADQPGLGIYDWGTRGPALAALLFFVLSALCNVSWRNPPSSD